MACACGGWEAGPGEAAGGAPSQITVAPCSVQGGAGGAAESDGLRCAPAFASGVNVAWLNFAADVPSPKLCDFKTLFTTASASGARVIRWWLHTDGTVTPGYDADGFARVITTRTIKDTRAVLDLAQASHVMLVISLWSFDMLRQGPTANNKLLMTDDAHRQAYVDNVLTPLATALKGHPALYAWEAFNEPEGMTTEFGWVSQRISMADVQRTVNWFGGAIHDADPGARFTNGCWSFPACSALAPFKNYYSDEALRMAGDKANGTLDFYEVHYYPSNGVKASPFVHPADYWQLDKPIVIGEFHAVDTDGVARDDLFTRLYDTGYNGAWAWQYANADGAQDFRWPAMQQGLENLLSAQPASLEITCE